MCSSEQTIKDRGVQGVIHFSPHLEQKKKELLLVQMLKEYAFLACIHCLLYCSDGATSTVGRKCEDAITGVGYLINK